MIIGIFVILAVGFFAFGFSRPGSDTVRASITGNVIADSDLIFDTPIDKSQSTFEFEGFGPGKSHVGTFNEWDAQLAIVNGQIGGMEGAAQAASITTGITRLDAHLQSDDFFDAAQFPTIRFQTTSFNPETNEMAGALTLHGVTHEITFPVTRTENSIRGDFVIDTTPFGFKYAKITNQVRIAFTLVADQ